jgi:hypothetical protein
VAEAAAHPVDHLTRVADRGTSTKPGSPRPHQPKDHGAGGAGNPSFRNQETGVWAMKGNAAMVPRPWKKGGVGVLSKGRGQGGVQVLGERVFIFHRKRGSLATISGAG